MARRREHGEHLAFVDLRDHSGILQCVVDGTADLRSEYVVAVTGTVRRRPEGMINDKLPTGQVEVGDCEVEVLAVAEPPPFAVDDRVEADEAHPPALPLRRPAAPPHAGQPPHRAPRSTPPCAVRWRRQGFCEVETPLLWAPTPEGAREFAVPSRLHRGDFYVLPQSPQLAKQLLMVGGFDRYYQIARCLRDEDLRADRQFEFTQLDLEASFVGQDDVIGFVSDAVREATVAGAGHAASPPIDHHVGRGARPVRHGQARPALRYGAGRPVERVRRHRGAGLRRALRQGDRRPR